MEIACNEKNSKSLPNGVYELPGEPAIVINGVPPTTRTDGGLVLCETASDLESRRNINFGEWLVGRYVRKQFDEQLYSGEVTEFDKEAGWYKVLYDDGDYEDLEWRELQEVLLPYDIMVPLKTLASKVIKKKQKRSKKSGRSVFKTQKFPTQINGNQKELEDLIKASPQ